MKKGILLTIILSLILLGACNNLNKQDMNKQSINTEIPHVSDFPLGSPNVEYAQYFSGRSWLARLTSLNALNAPISNVTFEPRCRNNWHSHTGGQILIAVGGVGYYQEKGKDAICMKPGDIIEIAPNVVHWHGAAPDSWFSHLALSTNSQINENTWFDPVSEDEYAEATK